jgi:hypothetical protein
MGIQSYLAHLIEAGSARKKGESADPKHIRYRTSYYPSDVGVELVIDDKEELEAEIQLLDPRLAEPLLQVLVYPMDYGLAAKSSEGGRGIHDLQKDNSQPRVNMPAPQPLDEMNYGESKQYDQNRNY